MAIAYEEYCEQCKRLGFKPTMTPKQIDEMNQQDKTLKVRIAKDQRPKEATFNNYEGIKNV